MIDFLLDNETLLNWISWIGIVSSSILSYFVIGIFWGATKSKNYNESLFLIFMWPILMPFWLVSYTIKFLKWVVSHFPAFSNGMKSYLDRCFPKKKEPTVAELQQQIQEILAKEK